MSLNSIFNRIWVTHSTGRSRDAGNGGPCEGPLVARPSYSDTAMGVCGKTSVWSLTDELRWRSSCCSEGFWAKTKAVRSRGEDELQQRHVMFCTPSVRIKWKILHFTSRLHILGRHRWVCNVGECWALRWGLSSTRDSFFCGWSSTTFLFVNRILEQVGCGFWFLFLPCDVGLLHYSIIWSP